MNQRQKRIEKLNAVIDSIDAGVLQIHVYKGMPVKMQIVGNEISLDGEDVLDLNKVEFFSTRKWWNKSDS